MKGELEEKISRKGYQTLAWSKVGWVRFFSKKPVFVPDDLKAQKLGTSESEPELMDAFKAMGYNMVPIAMNQILVNLSGGLIDAVYQSPVTAGGLQIFGLARNMASIRVAPFMGAILMTERAWRSIPEKYRPALLRLTREVEAELDQKVQTLEAEVIDSMTKYGLVTNTLSAAQEKIWYDDMDRVVNSLLGSVFDGDTYRRIDALLRPRRGR